MWDAIIIGGGAAGLSAALVLGRCNRSILVCDSGKPRSRHSREMHCFPTREGIAPAKFRRIARQELRRYRVELRQTEVTDARRDRMDRFRVRLADGRKETCRKLLLATGLVDELPPLRGIQAFYGRSVFHCPYCDGWELAGKPLAVYGRATRAYEMCRALTAWSDDVALCADGASGLSFSQRQDLERNGIEIIEERILRLAGRGRQLDGIALESGRVLARRALFFNLPTHSRSNLAQRLGCQFRPDGGIRCTRHEASSVPGVYVAGNIIRDVQLSVVAAAEGAKAAFGINRALTREDFEFRATGRRRAAHPSLDREGDRPVA